MQKFVLPGAQNESVTILALDSGTGAPVTTMTSATPGLALWYRRAGADKVAISPSDLTGLDDAHTDGGLYHIGDGYYRLDVPDAAFADGSDAVLVGGTATGIVIAAAMVQIDTLGEGLFDVQMSGHDSPGTIGEYISRISTGRITVASPVDQSGNIYIVPGHDYAVAGNNVLQWTNTGEDWPDLTSATITFTIHNKISKAGSCTNPGESAQVVRVALTDAETATLTRGRYNFKVTATLTEPGSEVILLVYGLATIGEAVAAPAS